MEKEALITTLTNLGKAYKTDKYDHGYLPAYALNLPGKCNTLLEIGVARGSSLMMWNALFGTDCDIHAIDLFGDEDHVSQRWCRRNEFVPHKGDQSDIAFMYRELPGIMFDVIIDDGSHRSDHQIITFKHLFVNNLKGGGLYVIEDLHCCLQEHYWQGQVKGEADTILAAFKNFLNSGHLNNVYFQPDEFPYEQYIAKIEICCDEKIAFVWKK